MFLALQVAQSVLAIAAVAAASSASPTEFEFTNGTRGWSTVLDGVMGGRSTGSISQEEAGILRFTGDLSLENNGGFSQMRTNVEEGAFAGERGLSVLLRGDGRQYQFDVRVSNARMMAGSYQLKIDTTPGEWITVDLPFDEFNLFNFGQLMRGAGPIRPEKIESIGITLSDKKPGQFALDVDWIRPLGAPVPEQKGSDLATVAGDAGLTTLLALVKAAGLELPKGQRVTIFAPTNDAFAKLAKETVEFLTSPKGKATLQAVLKHHVVTTTYDSAALLGRRSVRALSGQTLEIDADQLTVDGSRIVAADVAFDAGLVHVIDAVMMPELRPIAALLESDPRLSTLRKAVEVAGIGSQIGAENPGPWTVLAPSNEAFAALPAGALEALLADRQQLISVLTGHVIPSAVRREQLLSLGSARTLMGEGTVEFKLSDGALTVGGAKILAADIEASNGIVHVIDRVLLPAARTAPIAKLAPMNPAVEVKVATLLELAIARGVPLFNAGERGACAAIYEVAISAVVTLGEDVIDRDTLTLLKNALREGASEKSDSERAWLYRAAMDKAYAKLEA